MTKHIHVAGAVIQRDGLILCAQRGPEGNLPGTWEFPGGKIEPGEAARQALEREIREELLCQVAVGDEAAVATYDYPFATVTMTTFYCELVAGEPQLTEHSSVVWLPPDGLRQLEWAPLDLPTIDAIERDLVA